MGIAGQILSWLAMWVERLIEAGGYPGLALFMMAASLNLPLPSEIAYGFSGFLSAPDGSGRFNLGSVIAIGTLANVLGASLNYWIGARGRNRQSDARFFLVPAGKIAQSRAWFSRWGGWGVFLGHLTPGIRAFIGLPAGWLGMGFPKYLGITLASNFIWASFWSSLGYKLGVEWERVSVYARKFDMLILALIIVAAVWWLKKVFLFKQS